MLYDCKNSGKINQMERKGVAMRFCTCLDLKASAENTFFTGPQCAVSTNIVDNFPTAVAELTSASISEANVATND